jgi:hypothetical protein
MACTPSLCILAEKTGIPFLWAVTFVVLMFFGWFLPYRFGRAPYSYVFVSGLVFFVVGSALALVMMAVFGFQ